MARMSRLRPSKQAFNDLVVYECFMFDALSNSIDMIKSAGCYNKANLETVNKFFDVAKQFAKSGTRQRHDYLTNLWRVVSKDLTNERYTIAYNIYSYMLSGPISDLVFMNHSFKELHWRLLDWGLDVEDDSWLADRARASVRISKGNTPKISKEDEYALLAAWMIQDSDMIRHTVWNYIYRLPEKYRQEVYRRVLNATEF